MSFPCPLPPTVLILSILTLIEARRHLYDDASKVHRLLQSRRIDPLAIPISPNTSEPFPVKAHFLLQNLIGVDSHSETMRLTASIALLWEDYNLRWSPNDAKILWISVSAKHVWYPQLLLTNFVGFQTYVRPDPRFDDFLLFMNGTVILRLYYTFDTKCNAQFFKFPRDTMVCKLSFVSSIVSPTLVITADHSIRDDMIAFNNDDREWHVTKVTFKSGVEKLNVLNRSFSFSAVNAEISAIRSIGYYLVVAQFPILMMSVLIVLSSFISVVNGERLEFVTQLCLTYIVFLLLLDSILPKSSLPLLSVCVVTCFCLSVINVIEAVAIRELLALSSRQGEKEEENLGEEEEHSGDCESIQLVIKGENGKDIQDVKRNRKRRKPWKMYAERLDKIMLSINVTVVILIIILNIGVVYS